MTKYETIANKLKDKIHSGELAKGSALPYEYELCEQYQCSKQTMKKALEILVFEGLIYRQRGKGTFVKSTFDLEYGEQESSYVKGHKRSFDPRHQISTTVLRFDVIHPSDKIAEILNISTEQFVYYFIRKRYVDGVASSVIHSYVPIKIVPNLTQKVLENSFFSYIEEDLKLKIKSVHKKVTVSPSDSELQQLLNLKIHEPIAVVEGIHYLSTGEIFEYSVSNHSYKDFVFNSIHTNK